MRSVYPFIFAAVAFFAVASTHAVEASCDLSRCMSVCRSEYDSGCAGMCGKIISMCRQLTVKPRRTRSARPNKTRRSHRYIRLDAQARSSLGRIN
jgi:hypothetical protein